MADERISRFQGLTSNGILPGGEKGRFYRRLQATYGIQPIVTGGETRRQRQQRKRGRKPDKGTHLEPVGNHGVMKVVPNK